MNVVQYDFFQDEETLFFNNEIKLIKELCQETKSSSDKVRKSLFAQNNELKKMCSDLISRLEIIEKNICTS